MALAPVAVVSLEEGDLGAEATVAECPRIPVEAADAVILAAVATETAVAEIKGLAATGEKRGATATGAVMAHGEVMASAAPGAQGRAGQSQALTVQAGMTVPSIPTEEGAVLSIAGGK